MGKIRETSSELAMWEALGTDKTADQVRLKDSQLDQMLKGEPAPWDVGGEMSAEGRQLFYGRKFHLVMSEKERCMEQLVVMRTERSRLLAWLEHQIKVCTDACGAASTDLESISPVTSAAEAWGEYGSDPQGALYFVRQHLRWCIGSRAAVQALAWG
jgi:hypothetical protein